MRSLLSNYIYIKQLMTVSREDHIVNTFHITYVFLITTEIITAIESLTTKEEKV